MPVKHKTAKAMFSPLRSYVQVLCVFLAFTVMAAATFLFEVNIERQHLEHNTEILSEQIEERLTANLHELKTFLYVVSETIRTMLLWGADFEEVKTYIIEMTNFGQHEDDGIIGFASIFAIFDVFGGAGINGLVPDMNWETDLPDYMPQERPWYIAADRSNGEIVETGPYVDALNQEVSITYAHCIYDDSGRRLAIICLDILLDRINKISSEHHNLGIHSWMMLDKNFTIISYPFEEFLGMTVREAKGSGIEDIADRLEQGLPVLSHKLVNPLGETKIYSVRQASNGWYIGVSTPEDSYYANIKSILLFLVIFGLFMSFILSAILLRDLHVTKKAIQEKNKAVEEKNTLINLENIMNGLDVMIYVTEPETSKILFINDSMKRHYNINGDCIGQLCYKVFQKDFDYKCEFCPCFPLNIEPDKTIIWEEHSTLTNRIYRNIDRYIPWPNNKTVHIQHSVDMTELIAARDFAEESSRHKSAFLSVMSHEMRTPMNAILGIAEIQLQNEALSSDMAEALGQIYESGDLLLSIVNDILDLSKIETGKMELVPIKYDIPSLINDTVQLNCMRYENKPVEFTLHIDENTPLYLFGDELRIKQVLNNALSNAFKYTAEGKIEFSVFTEDGTDGYVTIFFRVSDTGQGMTEEQVARLFDEYTRFNAKANRETVGTGLGMNITKRLVDLMNGSVSVQSEPGKGTVFTVGFPQKRTDKTVCGPDLSLKLSNFKHENMAIAKKMHYIREYMPYGSVLLVDDVVSNLYVAKGMLSPYGLKIETAFSGFEAISKIKSGCLYDIIFLDHMMPKMDGIETIKILRGMGYTNAIIALTANALIGQEKMFLENGFDSFISKPIDSRELNLILNEFIRNKKPPEVVEAARREKEKKNPGVNYTTKPSAWETQPQKAFIDEKFKTAAVHDINNALNVLEEILPKINTSGADLVLFATTVHGMKSVLSNIGENQLSDTALELEKAAADSETDFILSQADRFIKSLRSVMEKIKLPQTDGLNDNSHEVVNCDMGFFRSKLEEIKTACEKFNITDAKTAVSEIKQKTWPGIILGIINEISLLLIRGEYSKVASAAEKAIETTG